MILMDTNVVSEVMLSRPDERILRWLDQQPQPSIWTTSVTVFEICFSLKTTSAGKRQIALMDSFERWLDEVMQQ